MIPLELLDRSILERAELTSEEHEAVTTMWMERQEYRRLRNLAHPTPVQLARMHVLYRAVNATYSPQGHSVQGRALEKIRRALRPA
jgi:hypothetical protein